MDGDYGYQVRIKKPDEIKVLEKNLPDYMKLNCLCNSEQDPPIFSILAKFDNYYYGCNICNEDGERCYEDYVWEGIVLDLRILIKAEPLTFFRIYERLGFSPHNYILQIRNQIMVNIFENYTWLSSVEYGDLNSRVVELDSMHKLCEVELLKYKAKRLIMYTCQDGTEEVSRLYPEIWNHIFNFI
jgi:hypothetical protein